MNREPREKCPKCGAELDPGSEPVTTGGIYGDYRIAWGQVGGVHTTRRVRIICHTCHQETPLPFPFDD